MGRKSRKADASRDASGVQDAGTAEKAEAAREAVSWILGRLDVLEYLVLFLAMVMALLGGALVAWILTPVVPLSFRWTWALASVLAFILPAGFVYLRELRRETESTKSDLISEPKDFHG